MSFGGTESLLQLKRKKISFLFNTALNTWECVWGKWEYTANENKCSAFSHIVPTSWFLQRNFPSWTMVWRSRLLHQAEVFTWHSVCITPHLQAVRENWHCFDCLNLCSKSPSERAKTVSLPGSNLLLYLRYNSKYFMGFITYKRHISHLYGRRVIPNVSSAPEDLVTDLLPGSKTQRSLQNKTGVRVLSNTQKTGPVSAYQLWHGVHIIAFSLEWLLKKPGIPWSFTPPFTMLLSLVLLVKRRNRGAWALPWTLTLCSSMIFLHSVLTCL